MMNRISKVLGIMFLLVALNGCGKSAGDKVIRIGLMADTVSIPYCIAYEKGFFEKEGVKVELRYFKSAQERDSALQAKELDGISSDIISLLLLKNSGTDFRAVTVTDGIFKIVSNPNISALNALEGKKIGISSSTLMEYAIDQIMDIENISNVEKVNIPAIPARLEMLNGALIDAAIMPEPFASSAIFAGNKELADLLEYNLKPSVFLFSNDFIKANENDLQKFYVAYNRAVDYINATEKVEYAELITQKIGFPSESVETIAFPTFNHASLPDNENLERANQWLIDKGITTKTFTYEELTYGL